MSRGRSPLFLKPQVYRRRRLRDAARLLPLLGGFLFLLPVLWAPPAGGGAKTATDGVYLFVVWLGLVAVAAALAPRLAAGLASDLAPDDRSDDPPDGYGAEEDR